jgi:ubiquinone/menaquinone biosynthesis C-methylase UbiE
VPPKVKSESPNSISYSDRFKNPTDVEAYESREYGARSYPSFIWQLQQPVVEQTIRNLKDQTGTVRLLDFACGTGRIISFVESMVDTAEGVDLSETMVELARRKCKKATLRVGNILTQPELLQGSYDVITCFRFILNVEPELRSRVLQQLRRVLREPQGLLIVNIHGNSRSFRHPAVAWRRWRERGKPSTERSMLNEMSPSETRTLLKENGFQIVREVGFGLLPQALYRTPLRGLAAAMDHFCAGEKFFGRSIDLLFVCHPAI